MADNSSDSSKTGSVHYLEVAPDDAGQRLDNYLGRHCKGVPKSRLQRAIRGGEVRVNSGRRRANYRIAAGDRVRVPPLVVREQAQRPISDTARSSLRATILHEDSHLLVINKPAGWAVHGGSGISAGVVETLRTLGTDSARLELVHRIDRATSGCLVLAKKRSALRTLHAAFREGNVDKRYVALVAGDWPRRRTRCDAPLDVRRRSGGERTVAVALDGKAAETLFELRERLADASLIAVHPLTGRTHQIRVHTAHLEAPIAGDERYGDAGFNARMRDLGLNRLFLHASEIAFEYPAGEARRFTAPLPPELKKVLSRLRGTVT